MDDQQRKALLREPTTKPIADSTDSHSYASLKVLELKEQLRQRGIKFSSTAKKADLVSALHEHDATTETETIGQLGQTSITCDIPFFSERR